MDAVLKFLSGVFQNLFDFFSKIIEFIVGFFSTLGQLLVDSFFWCFTKLSEFLCESAFSLVASALEGFGVENTLWVTEIYETMNFFVPLNELFSISLLCFSFWIQVFAIKILLKAIPTIY